MASLAQRGRGRKKALVETDKKIRKEKKEKKMAIRQKVKSETSFKVANKPLEIYLLNYLIWVPPIHATLFVRVCLCTVEHPIQYNNTKKDKTVLKVFTRTVSKSLFIKKHFLAIKS